jgi:hypothetical protein
MTRRLLGIAALVLVWITAGMQPASAGGSTWKFDADAYQPGDTAFAWAPVAWEHWDRLGTPEDGPYSAYVAAEQQDVASPFPSLPVDAVRVATVAVSLDPYDAGGMRFGRHHATVRFVVPDLPPGRYSLVHCNAGCVQTLGDITYGLFTIEPRVVKQPATTPASSTTTEHPSTGIDGSLVIGGSAAAVVAGIAGTATYARRKRAHCG